uniref:C-type LECtin n=1 Tax=Acrobeloides nanus TaxID=290746 RepID=A0A914C8L9_9BILA
MKFNLLFFTALFVVLNAAVIPSNKIPSSKPECSTNASTAYLDIILIIDTSANMGSVNLRKISTTMSLIMPKFTIGNNWDLSQGYRNTRISVVTYDTNATIVANFTDINSIGDLNNILNTLTASNSQEANFAFSKAYLAKTGCTSLEHDCADPISIRPTAFVVFAAVANSPDLQQIPQLFSDLDFYETGALITVNFNTTDQTLTNFLQNITHNYFANASMYNFTASSNTLTKDLEWALLQANCYCADFFGTNAIYFDPTNNRYTRYAECMILGTWEGQGYPNDTIDMCSWSQYQKAIPAFVLSAEKTNFIQKVWMGIDPFTGMADYPYYIGLHKNQQGQWTWYDYNKGEFPLSSYTNWSPGYPNGAAGCAIMDSNDKSTLVWKNYGCNTEEAGVDALLCQVQACDPSSIACCLACNAQVGGYNKKKLMKSKGKNRYIRKMKMINGKPVRID